jgi:hypothetical protein
MISIKTDLTRVQKLIENTKDLEQQLIQEAYQFFKDITPIDTGNARRNTVKAGNSINANYPYAERLDKGWSKQFDGKGMSGPTMEHMEQVFDKLLSNAENKE